MNLRWLAGFSIGIAAATTCAAQSSAPPDSSSAAATGPRQLDAVNVDADRYKPLAPAFPNYLSFLARPQIPGAQIPGGLGLTMMSSMVVTATRTPLAPENAAASVHLL